MQNAPLSVGDPIKARCTKCRKNTEHIIVTITEEKPDKVQCTCCNRQHKFRPPTAAKKTAAKRATSSKDLEKKEWKALQPNINIEKSIDYSMTTAYKIKDLIDHPVFGLGIVKSLAGPHKIKVLFEEGIKIMRCK